MTAGYHPQIAAIDRRRLAHAMATPDGVVVLECGEVYAKQRLQIGLARTVPAHRINHPGGIGVFAHFATIVQAQRVHGTTSRRRADMRSYAHAGLVGIDRCRGATPTGHGCLRHQRGQHRNPKSRRKIAHARPLDCTGHQSGKSARQRQLHTAVNALKWWIFDANRCDHPAITVASTVRPTTRIGGVRQQSQATPPVPRAA